jgi:hypothetical protein
MVRKSGYRLPDADIDLAIVLILGILKRIYVRSAFTCPSKLGRVCLEDILLEQLQGVRQGRASYYPPFIRVLGAKE